MRSWSTIPRLAGGGALALALLTGCAGDATVTDPALALPTLSRDSLRPSFTVAPPLDITPANELRCESRTVERDAGGRFVRWRASQREQVTVARGAADTVLTRYEAYAFDRTGAQTAEAQCILRRGTSAKQFMRHFFERPGRGGLVGVLAEDTATPVPPGIPPVSIGAGTVCLFDVWSWQMQCGNTTCYPMFAARAPTGAVRFGLTADPATRVGGPTARLIGGWECPGVGHLSLNGNGTLTLHPDGSGGGGSGGGGGCGGGSGGGGRDSAGDGSVNPPGSGGGATSWWGASCDTLATLPMPVPDTLSAPAGDTIPACPVTSTTIIGYAWCTGETLSATRKGLVEAARDRMRAIGGECANMATVIDSLLAKRRIRVFPHSDTAISNRIGGGAPLGAADRFNTWMVLSSVWFDHYASASQPATNGGFRRTLQATLAHEVDHILNRNHSDPAGFTTPNSQSCSDVP